MNCKRSVDDFLCKLLRPCGIDARHRRHSPWLWAIVLLATVHSIAYVYILDIPTDTVENTELVIYFCDAAYFVISTNAWARKMLGTAFIVGCSTTVVCIYSIVLDNFHWLRYVDVQYYQINSIYLNEKTDKFGKDFHRILVLFLFLVPSIAGSGVLLILRYQPFQWYFLISFIFNPIIFTIYVLFFGINFACDVVLYRLSAEFVAQVASQLDQDDVPLMKINNDMARLSILVSYINRRLQRDYILLLALVYQVAVPLYSLINESGENALHIFTRIVVVMILTMYTTILLVITKVAAGSGSALRRYNERVYRMTMIEGQFILKCTRERQHLLDHFLVLSQGSLSFRFLGREISLETAITLTTVFFTIVAFSQKQF